MSAVAKQNSVVPMATTIPTPMDLLTQAVAGGNIELAEKLMGLQERWEKNQARKAFDDAIADTKRKLPIIVKGNAVSFGNTNYKFEDLATIARAIDPILAAHGLSYRFRTKSEPGNVTVSCIISHRDGHAEENSLTGPVDSSGGKNAIQAIGSSCTYLQRYTLKAALGLASSIDDDATTANSETIDQDQLAKLQAKIADIGGKRAEGLKKGFLKLMKVESLVEIPASKFVDACAKLEAKRGLV